MSEASSQQTITWLPSAIQAGQAQRAIGAWALTVQVAGRAPLNIGASQAGSALVDRFCAERAAHASAATVQNLAVDHRCCQVTLPRHFLDRTDMVALLQQMCREAVANNRADHSLGDLRRLSSTPDRLLEAALAVFESGCSLERFHAILEAVMPFQWATSR